MSQQPKACPKCGTVPEKPEEPCWWCGVRQMRAVPIPVASPPPTPDVERLTGVQMIAAERERQMSEEGWTPAHDDTYTDGSLAMAAAVLACDEAEVPGYYGSWVEELVKKHYGNRLRELVIAGALIAAEIDRLLRVGDTPTPGGEQPR